MTGIEQIRKACIEANPEIVELKFGCAVRGADGKVWTATSYPDPAGSIFADDLLEEAGTILSRDEYGEIIGRPIRLADVLLAIGKSPDYYLDDGSVRFKDSFAIRAFGRAEKDRGGWFNWNLSRDSLEDQSAETLAFIASILPCPPSTR